MKTSAFFLLVVLAIAYTGTAGAGENLLANPSGQTGATDGWTVIAAGGNGWSTSGQSQDGDGASFITSYNWCTRSQTIDLLAAGYSEAFLDGSPPIVASEWFKGMAPSNAADSYFLKVELRDANGVVVERWEAGTQTAPLTADGNWRLEEHRFENYPPGVRQIYWEDGGDDVEFWAGHYGTLLDAARLEFADPAPTAIYLTPGTYPVSAPKGGVSGVLTSEDTPGSTHVYELAGEMSPVTLVPTGAQWAYLDNGTDPGPNWILPEFDDSAWATGAAELGFGEGDEATPIAGQGTHFTNYFRHRFTIPPGGLAGITGLTLRLKRDDGALVYVNGEETVRDNMPAGQVTTSTPALAAASDDGQLFHEFAVPLFDLVEGENVLAVEIHQANLTSSDASFDLELAGVQVTDEYDNARFYIDGDRLRFAQPGPSVPVTVGASWTVNVRTTDDAGNTFEQLLTVTGVADPTAPPTAISIDSDFVTEGDPAGTPVGTLEATDADSGDFHVFDLVAGSGDADNGKFRIESNRLTTDAVVSGGAPTTLSVRVRATDRAGLTFEQALFIRVLDVNDAPTDIEFSGTTVESGAPAGTLVGILATEDADAADTHTYAFVPGSTSESVFGFGSVWRFLDDGSDLDGTNWATGYDDGAWKSGPGSFGYGDGQTTPVDFGPDAANKRITTYFRRSFVLSAPSGYDAYLLRILRDDGVAVYLNGVEVARDGLNAGAGAFDFALAAIGGADETTPVDVPVAANLFVAGENVLAAEIHQATANSSDLTFDLALEGTRDNSGATYFEIVNGNEIRTNAAFAAAAVPPGTSIGLVIESTDDRGLSVVRSFSVPVVSDDPNDLDGDGLPDAWELQYFATTAGQDGADDSDGDGLSNREELIFDTLPNVAASRLVLEVTDNGTAHTVTWPSSAQRRYRLQTSTTLAEGSWADTALGMRQGTGAAMSETVPDSGAPVRQFRLLVEMP